jgi:uncharacterized protein
MITDLVQIARLGEARRKENDRFRRYLKSHNYVERRLKQIAKDVENQIDCTECGNCCRVATAKVTDRDAARLAKFVGLPLADFLRDYTQDDEIDGRVLKRDDERGCVFLEGNECTVYEARPNSCELFPHVVKGEGSRASKMWQYIDRACYCPIVYNTMEEWKTETGFSPSPK